MPTNLSNGLACHILRMPHSRPIHLCLRIYPSSSVDAFVELISLALPRLEHLDLAVYALDSVSDREAFRCNVENMWRNAMRAMSSPAPMLHTLYISVYSDFTWGADRYPLRDDILGGIPGLLRSCSLQEVSLPLSGSCDALSLLTTFDYASFSTPVDTEAVLAVMPNLETLGLAPFILTPLGPKSACHAALKRLAVAPGGGMMGPDVPTAQALYQHLLHVELFVTCAYDAAPDDPEIPGPVRVYLPGTYAAVARFGDHGRLSLRYPTDSYRWPPVLEAARLVSLAVHEYAISALGPPPRMPQLRELTIVLASSCEYEGNFQDSGVFTDAEPFGATPVLRTVALCYLDPADSCRNSYFRPLIGQCACDTRALALADVVDFVAGRLRGPRRLARLVLAGVREIVDVDVPRALRRLRDVVDELQFAPDAADDVARFMACHFRMRSEDPSSVFASDSLPDREHGMWALI